MHPRTREGSTMASKTSSAASRQDVQAGRQLLDQPLWSDQTSDRRSEGVEPFWDVVEEWGYGSFPASDPPQSWRHGRARI
jgi:hypothetical protein